MKREAAEPNAPGMSISAIRSALSRRALSLASAPCSESLARAMSRRPDSTTTSRDQVRCHPSQCLSGGSCEGGGLCIGRCGWGQGLGWGTGAGGT